MHRYVFSATVVVGLLAGCAKPAGMMEMPKKPNPAPELTKLQCWIGNWSGTYEMVSPSPEEMKKGTPDGSKEMPSKFAGAAKYEWVLGGMFIKSEGWHEMCKDQKVNEVSFTGWDAKAGKYRAWSVSDWGEIGEGWMIASDDGKTWNFAFKGVDAAGKVKNGSGEAKFIDDKTVEWTWTERCPEGTFKLKGTDKKQ